MPSINLAASSRNFQSQNLMFLLALAGTFVRSFTAVIGHMKQQIEGHMTTRKSLHSAYAVV